ncbi:hypothetical protein EON73_01240 [bacterium]|nr:MAG: hypothetical protein EON73_01240 [bacterium]
MATNHYEDHPLYKKAKRTYYFDRWKWVLWNAFISSCLLLNLRYKYSFLEAVLCLLTVTITIFLLAVMPKTKFENSRDCNNIKDFIDEI